MPKLFWPLIAIMMLISKISICCAGEESYPVSKNVQAISVLNMAKELQKRAL